MLNVILFSVILPSVILQLSILNAILLSVILQLSILNAILSVILLIVILLRFVTLSVIVSCHSATSISCQVSFCRNVSSLGFGIIIIAAKWPLIS